MNIEKKKKELAEKKKKRAEYGNDKGRKGADGLPDLKYEISREKERRRWVNNMVNINVIEHLMQCVSELYKGI